MGGGALRHLWGFDSFQGFPDPTEHDRSRRNSKKGEWGHVRERKIHRLLSRAGCPKSHRHIIKGFFDASLKQYDGGPIGFLHLDVDLYDSYRTCLSALLPRMAKGGVIVFDEYGDANWPGATKAILEFIPKEKIRKINDTWFARVDELGR